MTRTLPRSRGARWRDLPSPPAWAPGHKLDVLEWGPPAVRARCTCNAWTILLHAPDLQAHGCETFDDVQRVLEEEHAPHARAAQEREAQRPDAAFY